MSTNKFHPRDSNHGIIRSTSVISLGTLTSRVLGFIRDVIIARLLGTGIKADAFFVALRIPNLFRDMVGEGATNSVIVPVLAEYKEKHSKERLWYFISVIFILSLIVLSLITIIGIVFAPYIVRLIAPGFIADPKKLELTVMLTRLMFPYLIFIGLTAYAMGILYTFRSFTIPAFGPCLLNLSLIGAAFIALHNRVDPVVALAIGVIVGGVVQLLFQVIPILRQGVRFKIPRRLNHPGARKIGKLLIPRLFGAAVYQLTVFIDTFCASLFFIVGAGGISAIYYANRVIQFPMGVFSVAMASAILPTLSGFAARNDMGELRRALNFALKNILLVMIPASIFLMLFATPLIRAFFERGEFNAYSTTITSSALVFYALGLVSFSGIKIMVTAFHALQDTRTPVRIATVCLIVNALLNFILMWPLKAGGIALASSLAATLDIVLLFRILNRRISNLCEGLGLFIGKVLLVSITMGAISLLVWHILTAVPLIPRLIIIHITAFLVFWIGCTVLKITHLRDIFTWIIQKI